MVNVKIIEKVIADLKDVMGCSYLREELSRKRLWGKNVLDLWKEPG